MERDGLVENAATVGEYLLGELHKIGGLKEARGRGLMIGIELDGSGSEFRKRLLFEKHIFTGGAGALDRAAAARALPDTRTGRPLPQRIQRTRTMKKFTCVADIGDLTTAVAEAMEIKRDRFQFTGLGRNKTLLMLFFNSSLRTRLSTQKAAMNLGMNVMVLDVNQRCLEARNRARRGDGRRQGRTPARSHPRHGIVLRRDRRTVVRPLPRQGRRLRGTRTGTVHPLLGPPCILDGGRHAAPRCKASPT